MGLTSLLNANNISIDDVLDAKRIKDKVLLYTRNGVIEMDFEKAKDIYWRVKIRNRRKAFGL